MIRYKNNTNLRKNKIFILGKNNINKKSRIMKDQILGLVRHGLTFVGGLVVAKGLVDESTATEIIGGLMTLVGAVWSIVNKTPKKPTV